MLMKGRFVQFKDKKKVERREILIDIVKFIIVYAVIISDNVILGIRKLNFTIISVDIIMLIVFLIVLLQKNTTMQNEKQFQ